MKKYRVPVEWVSLGYLDIEANSREDLRKKLNDKDFLDNLPLPTDWDYADDSFKVSDYGLEDEDLFELIYDDDKEDYDEDSYIPF